MVRALDPPWFAAYCPVQARRRTARLNSVRPLPPPNVRASVLTTRSSNEPRSRGLSLDWVNWPADQTKVRCLSDKEPIPSGSEIRTQAVLIFLCSISLLVATHSNSADGSPGDRVLDRLDPNTAEWFELAQLPGVGKAMAERIVEFRSQNSSTERPGVVFQSIRELRRVRGIGPKLSQRLEPFLRFGGAAPDR